MTGHIYTKYRWFVLVTLCATLTAVTTILLSPITIIEEISKTIGLSLGETVMLAMVLLDIPLALSAVLGGWLADRFGVGRVWAVGSALTALGSLLVPVIGAQPIGLVAIRLMQGCGIGPILATVPLVVAQWFPVNERGTIFGISTATVPMGTAIGASFVPAILQRTGSWQTGMAWAAVFPLLALVLSLLLVFGPRPPVSSSASRSDHAVASWGEFKAVLLMPTTWAAAFCVGIAAWQTRVFVNLTPSYLAGSPPIGIGLGVVKAGALISGAQIPFVFGALLCGPITERVFRGRPRALVLISFLLCAVFFLALRFPVVTSSTLRMAVCLWMVSLAMSVIGPQTMTFVAKNYPERTMGKLGGVLIGCSTLGGVGGATLSAYLLHMTGSYYLPIELFAAASFAGLLVALRLTEPSIFSQWAEEKSAQTRPARGGPEKA